MQVYLYSSFGGYGNGSTAVYIDENLSKRLDKAAKSSGKSKSKWIAEAIERSLDDQWPQDFLNLLIDDKFAKSRHSGGNRSLDAA